MKTARELSPMLYSEKQEKLISCLSVCVRLHAIILHAAIPRIPNNRNNGTVDPHMHTLGIDNYWHLITYQTNARQS